MCNRKRKRNLSTLPVTSYRVMLQHQAAYEQAKKRFVQLLQNSSLGCDQEPFFQLESMETRCEAIPKKHYR